METLERPRFEPLTLGMLLDRTVRLYVDNFSVMAGISAIAHAPYIVMTMVVAAMPFLLARGESGAIDSTAALLPALIAGGGAVIVLFLWAIIVMPVAAGATTKAVSERYLGNEIGIGAAFHTAWNAFGRLFRAQIVVGFIVMLGFMLLIVPGILWSLSYSLVASVVILESLDSRESRQRSWDLVSGNRGRIFLVFLILFLINVAIGQGISTVLGLGGTSLGATLVRNVASLGVQVLISPIQAIATTLIYYDLRIRKEGFDIDMLRQALAKGV